MQFIPKKWIGGNWGSCVLLFILFLHTICSSSHAQELEPRMLANVPVGINFAVAGYGFTRGNILLDPVVPIEGLEAKLHSIVGAYVRAITLFGKPGKLDVVVPFATGNWDGIYEGIDTSTSRTGIGDPRIRFSFLFTGASVLQGEEYKRVVQKTITGGSIQLILPIGQYNPAKLINLGSNRLTIKGQLGASHKIRKFILEGYLSGWFFFANHDFWGGNKLEQKTLYAIKIHSIYSLPKGNWVSLGVGYALGGRIIVNEVERNVRISTFRVGGIYAMPLGLRHSLKFSIVSGIRFEEGADFDAVAMSYQYRWGGKQ